MAAFEAVESGGTQPTPLREVVRAEAILPLLEDPSIVARLLPLLPEGQRDEANLRDIVSPRLLSAVAYACVW